MRGEEDCILADDVMRAALGRKDNWERHGHAHWGYGVAVDLLALERRVAALEKGNCPKKQDSSRDDWPGKGWRWVAENEALEDGDEFFYAANQTWYPSVWRAVKVPPGIYRRRVDAQSNHDAAPAARAQLPTGGHASGGSDSVGNDKAEPLTRLGTGDTQDEPVAFAVMSGGRSYDIYDTRGAAEAICRWLCEEESGDLWRVVPLVPCDATQESHATPGECSVPPECTQQPAITAAELDALYQGTAVLLWEGQLREAGSEASRNLLQIAAALKGLRERLEGRRE